MAGPEATIERAVCETALKKLGVPSVKWGVDGWPDRIFFIPGGKPLFIEFKAPGEVPRPRQAYRRKCLTLWGYTIEIHHDTETALSAITRALGAARLPDKGR
jgi:hypothetical protein